LPDNPAIAALIIEFFYGGDGCLADIFPDDFSHIIPECTLALAMVCVGDFSRSWQYMVLIKHQIDSKLHGGVLHTGHSLRNPIQWR